MRIALFYHSLVSDWNHGNAHFLRGVASELLHQGYEVNVFEPEDAWSVSNLSTDHGKEALQAFHVAYPELRSTRYRLESLDLHGVLAHSDLVIVHEWNSPELVRRIGEHHEKHHGYSLFFHDTHHRTVTAPDEIRQYDLRHYDAVLAFGNVVRQRYLELPSIRRTFTWHEAADVRKFGPREVEPIADLVWVGNFGDDERTAELNTFLVEPVKRLGITAKVYGVRYPDSALAILRDAGIAYGGYLPNWEVPRVFAEHRLTVHIPRRPYARSLPGIPTIRPFEAMACGIPLICAPWSDAEGLFESDVYLKARDGDEMYEAIRLLLDNPGSATAMASRARSNILRRHTCGHRVAELMNFHQAILADRSTRSAVKTVSAASSSQPFQSSESRS